MRADGVVVREPCLDDPSRRSQRLEQVLVQALIAQATIERFHEAVLLRLAGRDLVPLDAGVMAPGEDGMAGQFGPVVADHQTRQPATFGDGAQLPDDAPA